MTSAVLSIFAVVLLSSVQSTTGFIEQAGLLDSGIVSVVGRIPEMIASAEARPFVLYVTSIILLTVFTIGIYHGRGVLTCASILLYVMALSTMSLVIRNCYVNHDFKFPVFLTATHFLSTAVVGSLILASEYILKKKPVTVPSIECVWKRIVPTAFSFVASLGFANYAILYSSAHFYEMASSTTPLVTAFIAFILGHGFDVRLGLPLMFATAGMMVVGFGELHFSAPGFLCCCIAVVLRSLKATLQAMLLKGAEDMPMHPIEVAVWTSSVSFFFMSAWSCLTEGFEPWRHIMAWSTFAAVMLTCLCATTLNIAALFVLRELGPVVQQIVGQLKGVISCLGARAVFSEVITLNQEIGYAMLLISITWYNAWDMRLKKEEKNRLNELSRLVTSKV